jgi:hypothetical protein
MLIRFITSTGLALAATFGTALVWLTVRLIVARIHAQQIGAHVSQLVVHIGALRLLVMVVIFVTVFLLTWRRR